MVSGQDNRKHSMVEVAIQTDNNEQVADFQNISNEDVNKNLVIGSSIIPKLERDTSIPADIRVHGYRGVNNKRKIESTEGLQGKKIENFGLTIGNK